MPVFMIERNFEEKLALTPDGAAELRAINDLESVRWLISFLSVDKRKTFCLYEAPSAAAVMEAARKAGIPADAIVQIDAEIFPNGETYPIATGRFGNGG